MLYIISGTSCSGKTIIAKKNLERKNISYLSLDSIVMAFTNGAPEFGINDKLFPNEIAKKIWKFTKSLCENLLWIGEDYVIEGEAFLPHQLEELITRHSKSLKICFLGYTEIKLDEKISNIKRFSTGTNDWLNNESDECISNHISNMLKYSLFIKYECEKYSIKYFDTSGNFLLTIEEAFEYLFNNK